MSMFDWSRLSENKASNLFKSPVKLSADYTIRHNIETGFYGMSLDILGLILKMRSNFLEPQNNNRLLKKIQLVYIHLKSRFYEEITLMQMNMKGSLTTKQQKHYKKFRLCFKTIKKNISKYQLKLDKNPHINRRQKILLCRFLHSLAKKIPRYNFDKKTNIETCMLGLMFSEQSPVSNFYNNNLFDRNLTSVIAEYI